MEAINVQSPPNINRNMGHVETIRNRLTPSENDIHSVHSDMFESARNSNASKEVANDASSQKREETTTSHNAASADRLRDALSVQSSKGKEDLTLRWRRMWKSCIYLVTIGMLIALLMGLNMSWIAITAALALVVLDFKDVRPCLAMVSYLLLIFFCGMFLTVDGFNKTGFPSTLWDLILPNAQIDQVSGIAVLAIIILILSNLASNVPTSLLLDFFHVFFCYPFHHCS